MCDLFSWIELDAAEIEKHHGSKVLFMTDETVKILRGRGGRKWGDDDVVGHNAIEAYYHNPAGTHEESRDQIPPVMAEMIRDGELDGMIAGILGTDREKWPKYHKNGARIMKPLENCHKNPEWILKAIVFYCKNYLIDGKPLDGKLRGAIKTYLGSGAVEGDDIDTSMIWCNTPQGMTFWSDLYYLMSGRDFGWDDVSRITPWTFAQKRAINKMPKVARK